MIQAFKIASWIIANWKVAALFIGANWETIVLVVTAIMDAQKAFVENADKKQWVMNSLIPEVKKFTPAQLDVIIDKLVEFTKLFGWLPAKKVS